MNASRVRALHKVNIFRGNQFMGTTNERNCGDDWGKMHPTNKDLSVEGDRQSASRVSGACPVDPAVLASRCLG